MAADDNKWPTSWNKARGMVVLTISRVGLRIPIFSTGMASPIAGTAVASQAKKRQKTKTKRNWMTVRVMGFGKALRMALEEVLVKAELKYHSKHSN